MQDTTQSPAWSQKDLVADHDSNSSLTSIAHLELELVLRAAESQVLATSSNTGSTGKTGYLRHSTLLYYLKCGSAD
jgi:hypothetical protein